MLLSDLPDHLLLLDVVPHLETRSLLNLRATCRRFQAIVDDESVWRHKVAAEFNFPSASTARAHTSNSWRLLYIGLARSHPYLWGQNKELWRGGNESRLAFSDLVGGPELQTVDHLLKYRVPFPLRLDLKGPGHVQVFVQDGDDDVPLRDASGQELKQLGVPVALTAGGFGFAALTSSGQVLGWGRLGHTGNLLLHPTILSTRTGSSSESHFRIRTIATGREFLVALAEATGSDGRQVNPKVIQWDRWDRPIWVQDAAGYDSEADLDKYRSRLNPNASSFGFDLGPPSASKDNMDIEISRQIIQAEAGWDFIVTLVLVRAKTSSRQVEVDRQLWFWRPRDFESGLNVFERNNATTMNVCQLPSLHLDQDYANTLGMKSEVVTQVSAGAGFIVALTSAGRLFQLPVSHAHRSSGHAINAEWSRMEFFDNMTLVANLLASDPAVPQRVGNMKEARITHISANFVNFAAYSAPVAPPQRRPELHDEPLPGEGTNAGHQGHNGIVLLGSALDNQPVSPMPQIVPELQGIGVIKVSFGDWHYGALTDEGNIFSWGGWQEGALGIYDSFDPIEGADWDEEALLREIHPRAQRGDSESTDNVLQRIPVVGRFLPRPPLQKDISEEPSTLPSAELKGLLNILLRRLRPRQVREQVDIPMPICFDDDVDKDTALPLPPWEAKSFAFDIAMGGWHSGALVLDRPREGRLAQQGDLTASQLAHTGRRLVSVSLVAFAVLSVGLFDGWSTLIRWVFPSSNEGTPTPWLNLMYYVPVSIPLVLYLVIARWTGDQFFLHA